jgi:uncharacterized protein YutE (UPF0331/DUF86 family)
VVDAERLRRLLQRVSDDLAVLTGYSEADPASLRADPARMGHVKYLFVTAIEGCVDAAQHVCASEGWGPPESNADAFSILAAHDVVDAGLARSMATATRFRNLLVHGYARVDDARVLDYLDHIGDLYSFVARVSEVDG